MANDDSLMSQDEIERLFSQTKEPAAPAKAPPAPPAGGKEDPTLAQDDLEKLLSEAGRSPAAATAVPAAPPAAAPPPVKTAAAAPPVREPDIATQDIEYLLAQAEKALESVNSGRLGEVPAGVSSYRLAEFSPAAPSTETATLDLIRDVELDLKIELGRTHMYLEDVLKLRKGSVVPLDKLAGDPVDIYVNGRLIARGEVLGAQRQLLRPRGGTDRRGQRVFLRSCFKSRVASSVANTHHKTLQGSARMPSLINVLGSCLVAGLGGGRGRSSRQSCRGTLVVQSTDCRVARSGAQSHGNCRPQRGQPSGTAATERAPDPAGARGARDAAAGCLPTRFRAGGGQNRRGRLGDRPPWSTCSGRRKSSAATSGDRACRDVPPRRQPRRQLRRTSRPQPPCHHPRCNPSRRRSSLGSHNAKNAVGKTSPFSALITVGGSLAIVLGLFFIVAWAMRKTAPRGSLVLPKEVFEILGRAPLGARQQVQLLRCGNKLLLVSITPGGAETLTEVTDPLEVDRIAGICQQAHPKSATTAFRQVFQQLAPKSGEPVGTRRSRAGRHAAEAVSLGGRTCLKKGNADLRFQIADCRARIWNSKLPRSECRARLGLVKLLLSALLLFAAAAPAAARAEDAGSRPLALNVPQELDRRARKNGSARRGSVRRSR